MNFNTFFLIIFLFSLSAVCRSLKNQLLAFLQCAEARKTSFWPFCSVQKHEKIIFCLFAVCRSMKNLFFVFLQRAEAWFLYFVGRPEAFSSSGLDFSLSLILPYPIRNSLPFTSLRSVTVGSGRDFLEGDTRRGQSRELLEQRLNSVTGVAAEAAHGDGTTAEEQAVRAHTARWDST